jgi:hypothetical protein
MNEKPNFKISDNTKESKQEEAGNAWKKGDGMENKKGPHFNRTDLIVLPAFAPTLSELRRGHVSG